VIIHGNIGYSNPKNIKIIFQAVTELSALAPLGFIFLNFESILFLVLIVDKAMAFICNDIKKLYVMLLPFTISYAWGPTGRIIQFHALITDISRDFNN
jgi:hypothetical protein